MVSMRRRHCRCVDPRVAAGETKKRVDLNLILREIILIHLYFLYIFCIVELYFLK